MGTALLQRVSGLGLGIDRCLLLGLFFSLTVVGSAKAQIRFQSSAFLEAGTNVQQVEAGDIDGDSICDLVAANVFRDGLTLLSGLGEGRFDEPSTIPIDLRVSAFVLTDINGDDILDLAVASDIHNSVAILLGDGSSFVESTRLPVFSPRRMVSGDFNGDGSVDFAVYQNVTTEDRILLIFGDGAGGATSGPFREVERFVFGMFADDLDGNDYTDLGVISNQVSGVTLFLNSSEGVDEQLLALPSTAGSVAVGDYDRDGNRDIAATSSAGVHVFLGEPGGFGASELVGSGVGFVPLLATDVDGDQRLDLVTLTSILFGDGEGRFEAPVPHEIPAPTTVADLDADGTLDALSTQGTAIAVSIGNASSGFVTATEVATASTPVQVDSGDFNQDGIPDLAYLSQGTQPALLTARGRGDGSFAPGQELLLEGNPRKILLSDFNRDGTPDAAVLASTRIQVFPGDSAGGFGPRIGLVPLNGAPLNGFFVAGDFTHDTLEDLVVGHVDPEAPGPVRSHLLCVYEGDGSGEFTAGTVVDLMGISEDAVATDVDRDGSRDLVVLRDGDTTPVVDVFLSDGVDGFLEPTTISMAGLPRGTGGSIVLSDFNSDGDLDLIYSPHSWALLKRFAGDGSGSFTSLPDLGIPRAGGVLEATDLDQDGHADLLYAQFRGSNRVGVLRGKGDGSFEAAIFYGSAASPGELVLSDLDGDGDSDVLVGSGEQFTVTTLMNRSQDGLRSRMGRVNAGTGSIRDVLLVNGSVGLGAERRLTLSSNAPLEVFMDRVPAVPAGASAPFVLCAWRGEPTSSTARSLPSGLGISAMPMPLTEFSSRLAVVWNNTGRNSLGEPNRPSQPSPSIVVSSPSGAGILGSVYLQGLIFDPGSAAARPASVTNGILLQFE